MKRLWQPLADTGIEPDHSPSAPEGDRLRARLQSAIERARLMPVAAPEAETPRVQAPAKAEIPVETAPQPAIAAVPAATVEISQAETAPAASSGAERRSAIRKKTTFSIGKIIAGEEEMFCLIRDMSDTGVRIEMRNIPPVGTRVMVEMRTIPPCAATIRWIQGDLAGLEFEASRAIEPKAQPAKQKQSWIARTPRFRLHMPAKLKMMHGRVSMETADITLGGLKLKGAHKLTTGTHADVMFGDSMRPIAGHVCWTTEDSLGFRFETALTRESLMAIMDMARSRGYTS